jgi:hypothetical protein
MVTMFEMRVGRLILRTLPVGEQRTGLWCEHCNLPSLLEQDCVTIDPIHFKTVARHTWTHCVECHRFDRRERPDPRAKQPPSD